MITAIIVDDEANSSNALKTKLGRHFPDVSVLAVCANAKEGIAAIESLQPQLLFLDIEMPRMNGFAMLQQLRHLSFHLIFTTAYDHYAIKAIRCSALDYLVKPIDIGELRIAMDRVMEQQEKQAEKKLSVLLDNLQQKKDNRQRIAVPSGNGLEFIKIESIIYLEASINYTQVFTSEKQFIVSRTLKDFEDMLPPDRFIRIHNSFIVNKAFVEKYIRGDGGQAVLSNGAVLDISKRKKAAFLKAIEN
ncbi:MAG TPA: LytTR family DNA-binding domain-containing protein [Chitinophagaceae bacterium]|nr:LytTR family DNA-binding domain-containing protein [Chitinophagaceae bacterium]